MEAEPARTNSPINKIGPVQVVLVDEMLSLESVEEPASVGGWKGRTETSQDFPENLCSCKVKSRPESKGLFKDPRQKEPKQGSFQGSKGVRRRLQNESVEGGASGPQADVQ